MTLQYIECSPNWTDLREGTLSVIATRGYEVVNCRLPDQMTLTAIQAADAHSSVQHEQDLLYARLNVIQRMTRDWKERYLVFHPNKTKQMVFVTNHKPEGY